METDRSTAQEVEELSRTLARLRADYATLEARHATHAAGMAAAAQRREQDLAQANQAHAAQLQVTP